MKEIDARGLSCPHPVILVTTAIKEGEFPFTLIVDTVTARENVIRAVKMKHCSVEYSPEGDGFRLEINTV